VKTFNDALESIKADATFDAILDNYQLNVPELPDI
jgi:ABC-type amino acid transport substrate-binding protein